MKSKKEFTFSHWHAHIRHTHCMCIHVKPLIESIKLLIQMTDSYAL